MAWVLKQLLSTSDGHATNKFLHKRRKRVSSRENIMFQSIIVNPLLKLDKLTYLNLIAGVSYTHIFAEETRNMFQLTEVAL